MSQDRFQQSSAVQISEIWASPKFNVFVQNLTFFLNFLVKFEKLCPVKVGARISDVRIIEV